MFLQVQIWRRSPTLAWVWSVPSPRSQTAVSRTRACRTPPGSRTHPRPSPAPSASACRPWAARRAAITRTYPRRTPRAPRRLRPAPSSPAHPRITCTTAAPPDPTSSPWCRPEEESARPRASYRPAPTPPQAPPSCTPRCPIRARCWWRPREATAVHQPAKPSGGRIDARLTNRRRRGRIYTCSLVQGGQNTMKRYIIFVLYDALSTTVKEPDECDPAPQNQS